MTAEQPDRAAETIEAMRSTAEELETTEQSLHALADTLPSPAKQERIHELADEITAEAGRIDTRARYLRARPEPGS